MRRRTVIGVVSASALLALVIAFDWNWLRAPLEHYLTAKSKRSVRIGDLHVSFGPGWQPTVRLRQVFVENAAWGSGRPMATAGEAAFTFDAATLLSEVKVVTHLRLVDADVSMERAADGLRNWRLTRPDDRGPGRLLVQRLEAHRTHITFADQVFDLDLSATSTPIATPAGFDGVAFANRITFEGRWHKAPFKAEFEASEILTLRDTGEVFPWRGHVTSGDAQLEVDGRAGDIFRQVAIDSHMQLRGQSLAGLQPWSRANLPATPPYRIEAHMVKDGAHAEWSMITAQVGRSDAAGRFAWGRADGRTSMSADLQSQRIDLRDAVWKTSPNAITAASAVPPEAATASPAQRASEPSNGRVKLERIRELDADVALRIAHLEGTPIAALESVQLAATAKAGVLTLSTLKLGLAGGHLTGQATLDAAPATPTLKAHLTLDHVQLGGLLPERSDKKRVAGFIEGQADMQTQGDGVSAWLADASGSARATLNGGSLSKLLDGELGLNGAQIAGAWLTDAEQVPIRCAVLAFDVRAGRATLKTLALETDKTAISGTGRLDLQTRALDVMLTPQSKSPGLLTLRRSIHVSGALTKPQIKLVDPVAATTFAACKA